MEEGGPQKSGDLFLLNSTLGYTHPPSCSGVCPGVSRVLLPFSSRASQGCGGAGGANTGQRRHFPGERTRKQRAGGVRSLKGFQPANSFSSKNKGQDRKLFSYVLMGDRGCHAR